MAITDALDDITQEDVDPYQWHGWYIPLYKHFSEEDNE